MPRGRGIIVSYGHYTLRVVNPSDEKKMKKNRQEGKKRVGGLKKFTNSHSIYLYLEAIVASLLTMLMS